MAQVANMTRSPRRMPVPSGRTSSFSAVLKSVGTDGYNRSVSVRAAFKNTRFVTLLGNGV